MLFQSLLERLTGLFRAQTPVTQAPPPPAAPQPEVSPATGVEAAPSRPLLPLPTEFKGTWRRDWRLRGELVGSGVLRFQEEGVYLRGRASSPPRALISIGLRLLGWAAQILGFLFALLTACGLFMRLGRHPEVLLGGMLCGVPAMATLVALPFIVLRRLIQPQLARLIPWSSVSNVSTDGETVQLLLHTQRGTYWGHLKPRWWRRGRARSVLDLLRRQIRMLPVGEVGTKVYVPRLERLLALLFLLAVGSGLFLGQQRLRAQLTEHRARQSGPLAGNPERSSAATLERLRAGTCAVNQPHYPTVRREGGDLTWEDAPAGLRVGALSWDPSTGSSDWASAVERARSGRVSDLFSTSPLAAALLLTAPGDGPPLAWNGEDGLRRAWCAGEVRSVQVVPGEALPSTRLKVVRHQEDLIIQTEGLSERAWILPIRRRLDPGPSWQEVCEVPVHQGRLGLLAVEEERRIPAFFGSEQEQALVIVLPPGAEEKLSWLASGPAARRCWHLEALAASGLALQRGESQAEESPSALYGKVASRALAAPFFSSGVGAERALDGVAERYAALRKEFQGELRGVDKEREFAQAVLSVMPWSALLDEVSVGSSVPLLERARQRMDGHNPQVGAGRRFLQGLVQAFLDRIPPDPQQWLSRAKVAQTYLNVELGTTWTLRGRPIRVGEQDAVAIYTLLGRYMLVDLGRRAEQAWAEGRANRLQMTALGLLLQLHDIHLDIPTKSSHKALIAWASGDFEYVLGRAWLKANEQLRSEAQAISAAQRGDYALGPGWSGVNGSARYARLDRDQSPLGWIALFNARKVEQSWRSNLHAAQLDDNFILACAASYVTQEGRTSGLAVVNGQVNNFAISSKMDGLVVTRTGKPLLILDLKRGTRLPGQSRRLRPLHDLNDLAELLDWLQDTEASAFQTHLLVGDGRLVIDGSRASPELRERRLVATAWYGDSPITAIIDIPGSSKMSLHEAAEVALRALSTPEPNGPDLKVEAVANLDVGSFDILQARDTQGSVLRKGPVALQKANNLLVVTP